MITTIMLVCYLVAYLEYKYAKDRKCAVIYLAMGLFGLGMLLGPLVKEIL